MSSRNDKAVKVFLIFILLAMAGFFAFTQTYENKKQESDNSESVKKSNNQSNKVEKIGDVSSISLYVTDYVYDSNINGYNYTLVELTDESKNELKKSIKNIELKNQKDKVIYGKYKLVLDDKILFFDIGNDYALYSNSNIVINFPSKTKSIIAKSTDTCSCCKTEKCKINLCSCSNN